MTKIRKGRNPRFQRAINLAKDTHDLVKAEVIAGYNTHKKLKDIDEKVSLLNDQLVPRNGRLTDAYLKLSRGYWSMLNILRARTKRLIKQNSRVELLEKELRDYVPDHWLFAEEETDDEEDNVSEDPDQLENDFDTDHLKPN